MLKRTFALLLLLTSGILFAEDQDQVKVSGKIIDEQSKEPVEYATVSILTRQDSSLINGVTTTSEGLFEFDLSPGDYLLRIQFISYETHEISLNVGDKKRQFDIGTIMIHESVSELEEIIVEGMRTDVEMKLDKRVYNISDDIINKGLNMADMLNNLPSISVDVDGNVSLRGNTAVKILVDGKPSGLVGIDDNTALRLLNSNLVERIEVITNPSARYEAEGTAGVINIVMKKEAKKGVNGSFLGTLGTPENHELSANVNFRRKWVNLFVNYGLGYRRSPREGNSYWEFYDSQTTTERELEMTRGGISNNFRFGSDFYINDKNTLTASAVYRVSDENNTSDIYYTDRDINGDIIGNNYRFNQEKEDEKMQEYMLSHKMTFTKPEHKLTLDVQFRQKGEIEDAVIEDRDLLNTDAPSVFQAYLNNENEENWLFQADYIFPMSKQKKFEAGARSTLRKIDNDYEVSEMQDGEWVRLDSLSNNFIYDEDIHAVYGIFANEISKWSYQLGLRAEYTGVKTLLVDTDEKNDNVYFNLFPSAHLTYKMTDVSSLQLSYSRRFRRPRFWDLNPFYSYADDRNQRSGNPNLKPEFSNLVEMGLLSTWANGSLYGGLYGNNTSGKIERIRTEQDGVMYSFPINLSERNSIGIEVNSDFELYKWWVVDVNMNFFYSETDGEYEEQQFYNETLGFTARLNSTWRTNKGQQLRMNYRYNAPENTTQGSRQGFMVLDIALRQDLFKGKGNIIFNARNVLNSQVWKGETFGDNFYQTGEFRWRPVQFLLSFEYRLNQKPKHGGRSGGGGGGVPDGL